MGIQSHTPAALSPGKTPFTHLYRRLSGPQGGAQRVRKISPSPGFDPRFVQPVASRYTDTAIAPQAHIRKCNINKNNSFLFSVTITVLLHTCFLWRHYFQFFSSVCVCRLRSAICSLFLICRPSSLDNERRY